MFYTSCPDLHVTVFQSYSFQIPSSALVLGDQVLVHHTIISDTTVGMEDNQKEVLLESPLPTSLQEFQGEKLIID